MAVVGGGPAGLMAAEVLLAAGHRVELFDRMPSVGRKFLLAGKGGLNLTHAEPFEAFVQRYAGRAATLQPLLRAFGADELRRWAAGLGVATFVGSSGRVFPSDMKAAPLLRAWLHRLRGMGLVLHMRHRWAGWAEDGALRFATPQGEHRLHAAATVLALGGGSWARLGSDGAWVPLLAARGVDVAPLVPSNCGFEVAWSEHLRTRFAGAPLKGVAIGVGGWRQAGEFVISDYGVEGSLVYAASARLRDELAAKGRAVFHLDLLPQRSLDGVARELAHPRGPRSLATHLKSRLKLDGAKAALLWETVPKADQADPQRLAAAIKALPITVTAARPLDEAISTAGGVRFEALDEGLMLRALPGVFVAGEMLDWEAPTGGYLLTACFAAGRAAGQGVARWLAGGGRATTAA
ncbi:MAG: TIGR03862 family flavoprotein [Rubrivivax sp.]|nr:TIGR03862 family flavoprotein [Rubrivivax sp.]